jgi:hypothetical protein
VGSALFPTASSSLGLIGGVLMTVWAMVFVGMTELVRDGLLDEVGVSEELINR